MLTVRDQDGRIVAVVEVHERATEPDSPHIWGQFTPGPGFAEVRAALSEFEKVYATGDLQRASEAHTRIDRMNLIATSDDGTRYSVYNVYFQESGLLFSVSKQAAPSP